MKKKKLLFMLSSMNIGGVEKSLLSLLSIIPKDQYEVTILLLEKKGDFLTSIPEWVKVEEATWYKDVKPIIMDPPQNTIKSFWKAKQRKRILLFVSVYLASKYLKNRFMYYRHALGDVPKHFKTYDIAVSYQGTTDTIEYYIAKKVSAVQKISWVHFDVSKHLINYRLYEKLYQYYHRIYVVSNEAKSRLVENIPSVTNKTRTFLNVVSPSTIREMAKWNVELDASFDGLKIVTVGRLSKEKGQDIAMKTLYKLLQEGYSVRWYCVGEGEARHEYENLIQQHNLADDFILLGSTTNPYPYMAAADIYVQTSRHEGYCLTLAEAKCLQKPIVTMNFTGANEQIKDGYNGFIADTESELYEKIRRLLNDPSIRKYLSNNLSTIETGYSTRDVFDAI